MADSLSAGDTSVKGSMGSKRIEVKSSSVRDLLRQAKQKFGIVSELQKNSQIYEEIVYPLTQEQMATFIALDMSGKKRLKARDRNRMGNDLYESIRKMVHQIASRYKMTCIDDTDDLSQDCFLRIVTKLWQFDSEKSKFTTWSWWVCCSTLNKKYRNDQKIREMMVDMSCLIKDPDQDATSFMEKIPDRPNEGPHKNECMGILAGEIVDSIRHLFSKYPEHKALLLEMFGNPDGENYVMPTNVSITEASRASGVDYNKARVFYGHVVQPYFRKQFKGC